MNLPKYIQEKVITSAPASPEKIHICKTGKSAGQIRKFKAKPARRGLLPITSKTLRLWVKQDKFPQPFSLNGLTVWESQTVLDWIEAHKHKASKNAK
ncbi:helix-turn-helix transcriptional regulator [Acinetobacter baumannii]|uniref:helix-turn-helix transcriptional regulator n=1 Tax=Acinetobacter baumannii TaxID=470 RepID=UPI002447A993|nr:AlpA family transcriptional regulator [Acinetobacter baumannii]EKU9949545.1 AlpA family transcriptional regulator [Acinetobacter baumannii]EKX3720565.1 AlpA family transcriptional regulator [Acinetobacter baumannii]EKX3751406.1 AlpA family transcriptional regulator [Acinetobacter baumannii]MDH2655778.1 AlpA family transcriptional regulator [Acinetobacter baumannii]